jgi:hypothetical protein
VLLRGNHNIDTQQLRQLVQGISERQCDGSIHRPHSSKRLYRNLERQLRSERHGPGREKRELAAQILDVPVTIHDRSLYVIHGHCTPHVRAALRCNHSLRVAVHPFKRRITRAQLAQPLLQLVNRGFLAAGGGGKAEGCSYERRVDGERWGGQGGGVLIRSRV